MYVHNLDPVIINFGLLSIRWYSLAYIFGILLGWWYGKKILYRLNNNYNINFSIKVFDDFITYVIISIILGGRIGYVFFYNIDYYILNLKEIFFIWEGGMSFHGGLIGLILGSVIFSYKKNIELLILLDVLACVAPIGIFFGRISNFINAELIGKKTEVMWAVIFPNYDDEGRHPSQLYEAVLEGLLLFFILNLFLSKTSFQKGKCAALFLILYGAFRVFAEIFREPDLQVGYLYEFISMGSILSLIMFISGLIMYLKVK